MDTFHFIIGLIVLPLLTGAVGYGLAIARGQRQIIRWQQEEQGRLVKQYRDGQAYGAEMGWKAARGEKPATPDIPVIGRSEEHTSELQSH